MESSDRYDSLFQFYAERWSFPDWHLLKAQCQAESNLDPNAVSNAGAVGLAQFMLSTWCEMWTDIHGEDGPPPGDRTNPEHSIELQAFYMAELLRVFGKPDVALAAYNWGWGNVRRHIEEHGRLRRSCLPRETRGYLNRIAGFRLRLPPCDVPTSG